MATNLWPNQWCEASGPVIGSVAADVDAPEHGGVFTLASRDHTADPRVPLAAGEQYLIQFVARRVSGALALNAGVWLTQKSTSDSWQMGSCTKVADLPIGGGGHSMSVSRGSLLTARKANCSSRSNRPHRVGTRCGRLRGRSCGSGWPTWL